MLDHIHGLLTESRNPSSAAIDTLPTLEVMRVINSADQEVAPAIVPELPRIAQAVDAIAVRLDAGGRMFYVGAGTSGRLGVLDASECPPTFNTPPGLIVGLIAGGDQALRSSIEKAEDSPEQAVADLQTQDFSPKDALVGIAASGRTPYVLGALAYARELQSLTVSLSCTPHSKIAAIADIPINPVVGPEIITGSTRMRAGTATKLVLNMLSTGVMIRLGYVYDNLMVNVQPTNSKLEDRARRIIAEITGLPYDEAARLLNESGAVRTAIVMHERKLSRAEAEDLLRQHRGKLRDALQQ
ncbi:MAG TPA: N-acetylmuramic acid 6-phosphate etherase [Bryobacteraceae bacterium]|nr:N-acetylmuramic acid 6-phosphate etherase [Bryobacteraceae bacterium]